MPNRQYSVSDYCFAIESFPHCNYEILREYLVLLSRRKLQSVISSVDTDYMLKVESDLRQNEDRSSLEDAASMELCTTEIALTASEESSSAYVAGWLESKCGEELCFTDEEPLVTSEAKDFIHEVSRGKFKTPHACTFELVRIGLSFVKTARHRACCRKRLTDILITLASFNDIDIRCDKTF